MFLLHGCKGTKINSFCIVSAPSFWLGQPQIATEDFICAQIIDGSTLPMLSNSAIAFHKETTIANLQFFENLLQTAWLLVHIDDYPTDVLHSLFSALIRYYNSIYVALNHLPQDGRATLFYQFISLVNKHSVKERSISFYADKLCLSPRYFSTLINEQSGSPAKFWIDTAVVTRAKVLLRHTSKTINQISIDLNFPNDSFFCKYFRRLTGSSPTDYRDTALQHTKE